MIDLKVLVSVSFKLAGGGIGNVAYKFVSHLAKNDLLERILATSTNKTDIDNELIVTNPIYYYIEKIFNSLNYRIFQRYFGFSIPYANIHYKLWDRYTANYIQKKCNATVYHGWTLRKSFIAAKKKGLLTSAEGSSSHPYTSCKLLNEEYSIFGLNIRYNNPFQDEIVKAYYSSDIIFAASPFVKQSMIEAGIDTKKVFVVPFGVDSEVFIPDLDKSFEKIIYIFVGSIMYRKGIQYVLPAFAELNLPNAELWVCGAVYNEIKPLVDKYRCFKNIKFLGHLDTLEYPEILRSAHVFVFPSIEEGSALVSYESMASGLPSIVTYNTGSVVRDGVDGFIVPIRDIESLKKRMKYFYDNQDKVLIMGKNARERACEYTWERHSSSRIEIYKQILGDKKIG